jgi:hypothetical protein
LTDDEEDNDNEGVDANFFLRLPSVDETNRIVNNNSCLLEEDTGSSKMSINVQQDKDAHPSSTYRFNTPPPRNRIVSNDSCLEEDKSSSRMSISLPQEAYLSPSRFKTPPPSTV